jgi:hypothetical protein
VRALRFNDAAAFLRRLDPEGQQRAEASWDNIGQVMTNPWIGGMFSRLLRVSSAPNADELIANYVTPILKMVDVEQMSTRLQTAKAPASPEQNRFRGGIAQLALNSTISGIINGTLASGLESEQSKAIQTYLGAVAAWLPSAGIHDPAKAKLACQAISAALSKFGTTDIRVLSQLELAQFLDRVSLALPDLKRAFAVYDLHIDQSLDSVMVKSTTMHNATIVHLSFTAFGMTHVFPLKMIEEKKVWSISADSPLMYWFDQRSIGIQLGDNNSRVNTMGFFGGMTFDGGNNGNGNNRQRGGGFGGGRNNQPAEPAPAPTPDPGF